MNFVLDENCQISARHLPKNTINAKQLYENNGLPPVGVDDKKFQRLAWQNNYTIITKDIQLVLRSNQQERDVVFIYGTSGRRWIFVSKFIKLKNRLTLKSLLANTEVRKGLGFSLIPYYAKGVKK